MKGKVYMTDAEAIYFSRTTTLFLCFYGIGLTYDEIFWAFDVTAHLNTNLGC